MPFGLTECQGKRNQTDIEEKDQKITELQIQLKQVPIICMISDLQLI